MCTSKDNVLWFNHIFFCQTLVPFLSVLIEDHSQSLLPMGERLFGELLITNVSSGCQTLDRLENNSRTVKGAQIIGQDDEALSHVLTPLKKWSKGSQNSCR